MARRSKIETSPHFNEIVEMLVAGYSGRYVSDYLENQYNEKITHTTLNKYKREHLNVKAAVRKKILEKEKEKTLDKQAGKELAAEETFEVATNYRFKDVQKLDDLISLAESINLDLDQAPYDPDKYDPYKEQRNKIKLKELGLKAIKLKYELIDEEEVNVNITEQKIIGLSESLEKSRQKFLKENQTK